MTPYYGPHNMAVIGVIQDRDLQDPGIRRPQILGSWDPQTSDPGIPGSTGSETVVINDIPRNESWY